MDEIQQQLQQEYDDICFFGSALFVAFSRLKKKKKDGKTRRREQNFSSEGWEEEGGDKDMLKIKP